MTAEQVFSIVNAVAVGGWLILIFGGRARWVSALVTGSLLPLLFAVLYGGLIVTHWSERQGGFGTLAEVGALFSNQWLLLAGWVHYLAFDLFIGSWQVRDAQKHRIPHVAVVPALILTFLFGPVGLLVYSAMRIFRTRTLRLNTASEAEL